MATKAPAKPKAKTKYVPPKMEPRTLEEKDYDAALAARAKAKQKAAQPAKKKKPPVK